MSTSPGIRFLYKSVPHISGPVFLFTALNFALLRRSDGSSIWQYVLVEAILFPVIVGIAYVASYYRLDREAAARGAILPPNITNKWTGGLNILNTFVGGVSGDAYPGETFEPWFTKYGTTVFARVFFDTRILTIEPEHIKAVLATDFDSFAKGETFKAAVYSILGTGVFNADGELWKFHRGMTRPFFSKDRISHFDLFDSYAEKAITLMKERLRAGYAVDFQDVASRFTLDSATDFLFGRCVHSLSAGLVYSSNVSPPPSDSSKVDPTAAFATAYADAFRKAQERLVIRVRQGPLWPLFEFWKDETREDMKIVETFLDPILNDALQKKRDKKVYEGGEIFKGEKEDEDESLLDHLVKLTDDKNLLKDETLNILLAARDTTAGLLTFVIYVLSQYPHVLVRLRSEILEHVGPSRRPTYDNIREMKYLRAVLNETMRLYPMVPFNGRECIKSTTIVNKADPEKPFYIPKGTRVTYSVLLMQRRKDLWGPDADQFDPDRFLDYRLHKYLTPNPFIFVPFNAGPRICLGQQFAYNEASFMLIRILQNFDRIGLAPESQTKDTLPPQRWAQCGGVQGREKFFPKASLTMYAHGGLWVRMGEASETLGLDE